MGGDRPEQERAVPERRPPPPHGVIIALRALLFFGLEGREEYGGLEELRAEETWSWSSRAAVPWPQIMSW